MKDVRYSIIYKYFLHQIKFGNFSYGDYLPPIRLVERFYHVSAPTVRNAYLLLQKEGYISMSPGRMTTVISRISEAECRQNMRSYYLARRDEICRLKEMIPNILNPLLQEGCRRLDDGQMDYICEAAKEIKDINFKVSFIAGQEMIHALNNQLAINLYYEIASFYQFPHTLNKKDTLPAATERCHRLSCLVMDACDRKDRAELYRAYLLLQEVLGEIIDFFIYCEDPDIPMQDQILFEWGVCWERPQLFYSLATKLISDIMIDQKFASGEYLPHYKALVQMYAVSLSTVRRTVRLLEEMGVVESLHGVGTKVSFAPLDYTKLWQGSGKHVITFFLEASQIVQLTFTDTADVIFKLSEKQRQGCIAQLQARQINETVFGPLLICLDYLLRCNDNSSLLDIGNKLHEGFVLGLPILEAAAAPSDSCHIKTCYKKMINYLENKDFGSFRRELKACMHLACKTASDVSAALHSSHL